MNGGRYIVGILVHGDNHFIVRGPAPDREAAFALARHWSVIQIGQNTPPGLAGWRISTKEYREDLQWAVIVPGSGETSAAVAQLLGEIAARGIVIADFRPDALSLAGPVSLEIYEELLAALRAIGEFHVEVKKTSIHMVRKSAFAGVHPRRQHLLLTIRTAAPISSPRIVKTEQVSKNRWHLEVKLTAAGEIDSELMGWLREAYALCV